MKRTNTSRKRNRLAGTVKRPPRPIWLIGVTTNMASQKILLSLFKAIEKEMPIPRKSDVIFNNPIVIEARVVTEELQRREANMSRHQCWSDHRIIQLGQAFV